MFFPFPAELDKDYDPWGRPGAGAPMAKKDSPRQTSNSDGRTQNQNAEDRRAVQEKRSHQHQQVQIIVLINFNFKICLI